jgi:hypothetical protein
MMRSYTYVGIRADENREGYVSSKETINVVLPFVEDGIVRDDVFQMLENSVGLPEYYKLSFGLLFFIFSAVR